MKIDLFGRVIEVVASDAGWKVFDAGSDGKKRAARDILIPSSVAEDDLLTYLDDLFHEHATAEKPAVRRLDQPITGMGASMRYRPESEIRGDILVNTQGVAMKRPSRICMSVSVDAPAENPVRVGGQSVMLGEGCLRLPEAL